MVTNSKEKQRIYSKIHYDKHVNDVTICSCGRRIKLKSLREHKSSRIHDELVSSAIMLEKNV